ncbi:MAG: MATE family efflux transporter [Bacteroidales bacterium]|nr:MATE family efflux transporter [Bacteroidales bacterium]
MGTNKDILLGKLRDGEALPSGGQIKLTFLLAVPAIFAQLAMCLMSFIDAAMVGRLGSAPAAAIGIVSTATWLFGSLCYANSSGFSVQIAHRCGAHDFGEAGTIFREGLFFTFLAGLILGGTAFAIGGPLPVWLGGGEDIVEDASGYFRIYAAFLPIFQIAVFCEASLIASGNLKFPSIVSMLMCLLDVGFNYIFIFLLDMGVEGAAIGTGLSELCAAAALLFYALRSSAELGGRRGRIRPFRDGRRSLRAAAGISWPLWIQNIVTRGAHVAATALVAPLGTIAIAANSFAIIAEGFCYLPGFGMQDAATTLVGQSLGAGRKNLARRFAWITICAGAVMMSCLAVLMWAFAPQIMGLMSRDPQVVALGAECLRIEAWAEMFFAVGIVGNGCCVGAGDTLVPSVVNVGCMWLVRIGLASLLIPHFGLQGYWIAMAVELSVRGLIFAARIRGDKWMKTNLLLSLDVEKRR